jgi:heat shock protein HspQ
LNTTFAKFAVGQIVHHKLFNYRGVVIDVDPVFRGTEDWYREMAPSRPPKDRPWYHVLMHGTLNRAYVAERNLELDESGDPVVHPEIDEYFLGVVDGVYVLRVRGN